MRKTEVKKLRKGQKVWYGGYEWKFHSANGFVNGIGGDSLSRIKNEDYDGYLLNLKAIDGKEYPLGGQYKPKAMCLINQYWLGVTAKNKDVEVNI